MESEIESETVLDADEYEQLSAVDYKIMEDDTPNQKTLYHNLVKDLLAFYHDFDLNESGNLMMKIFNLSGVLSGSALSKDLSYFGDFYSKKGKQYFHTKGHPSWVKIGEDPKIIHYKQFFFFLLFVLIANY